MMRAQLQLRSREVENLAGVLLHLDGFSEDDLERAKETVRWVLETMDINSELIDSELKNNVGDWADVCVALGWSSLMKQGMVTSFEQCKRIGVAHYAPKCGVGFNIITDFVGSQFEKMRADNLLHLHKLLLESHSIQEYEWVKGVIQHIELMHRDLTDEWDTSMMTA